MLRHEFFLIIYFVCVRNEKWLHKMNTGIFVSFFFSNSFVYDKMSCGCARIRVMSGKA